MKLIQARNFFVNDTPYAPLHINSCGHFYDIDCDTHADRPLGRHDYQLIYILEGEMHLFSGDDDNKLPAGSLIIFKPHEPQLYGCRADVRSAYIWVHFDGDESENMLRTCGLYDKNCFFIPSYRGGVRIIEQMMSEIRRKRTAYQLRLMGLFTSLLCELGRVSSDSESDIAFKKLRPALDAMENTPRLDVRVSEYAAMCHMSEFHFLHEFKAITGQSPISYRDDIIMRHSATLLESTSLSISEIAASFGACDALYFSKKFKKHFGVSPTVYRASQS